MVVKFTEVARVSKVSTRLDGKSDYILRDVFVNPEHVVCVREDHNHKKLLQENKLPDGLDSSHTFSNVAIQHGHAGMNLVVVGSWDRDWETNTSRKM